MVDPMKISLITLFKYSNSCFSYKNTHKTEKIDLKNVFLKHKFSNYRRLKISLLMKI